MAFRKLLIASLGIAWLFAGCRAKDIKVAPGPIEICYTSVRGASPRVVDYFVIVSATDASVAQSSDSGRDGIDCFVVPASVEPLFKQRLSRILAKANWSTLVSLPPTTADEPFRRLSIRSAEGTKYAEFHEYNPADQFLDDARFKRFYAIVSEVRLLGETFGVRLRLGRVPVAENIGMPLERRK